jgi:hypothetical protein
MSKPLRKPPKPGGQEPLNEQQRRFSIWTIWIAVVGLLLLQSILVGAREEVLSYSDFKTLVRAGKMVDVVIEERRISGRVDTSGLGALLSRESAEILRRSGEARPAFSTTRVDDPSLIDDLEKSRISYSGRVENTAHRAVLDELANRLMEDEVVEGDIVRELLRTSPRRDAATTPSRTLAGAGALVP